MGYLVLRLAHVEGPLPATGSVLHVPADKETGENKQKQQPASRPRVVGDDGYGHLSKQQVRRPRPFVDFCEACLIAYAPVGSRWISAYAKGSRAAPLAVMARELCLRPRTSALVRLGLYRCVLEEDGSSGAPRRDKTVFAALSSLVGGPTSSRRWCRGMAPRFLHPLWTFGARKRRSADVDVFWVLLVLDHLGIYAAWNPHYVEPWTTGM